MAQMHLERVRFVGVDKLRLDSYTAQEMQRACGRHAEHLRERAGDIFDVTVRVKAHHLPAYPERYAVLVEMSYPGGWLSGMADSPYLMEAVKHAFGKLEHQLEQASLLD